MQNSQFIIGVVNQFGRDKSRGHYVFVSTLHGVENPLVAFLYYHCLNVSVVALVSKPLGNLLIVSKHRNFQCLLVCGYYYQSYVSTAFESFLFNPYVARVW